MHDTMVRIYDAKLGAWRATLLGVVKGEVIPFVGCADEEGIKLDHAPGWLSPSSEPRRLCAPKQG